MDGLDPRSDGELLADLTAETFAAALEAISRYEPRPEPARGWLLAVRRAQARQPRNQGSQSDDGGTDR